MTEKSIWIFSSPDNLEFPNLVREVMGNDIRTKKEAVVVEIGKDEEDWPILEEKTIERVVVPQCLNPAFNADTAWDKAMTLQESGAKVSLMRKGAKPNLLA